MGEALGSIARRLFFDDWQLSLAAGLLLLFLGRSNDETSKGRAEFPIPSPDMVGGIGNVPSGRNFVMNQTSGINEQRHESLSNRQRAEYPILLPK